jgi:hypothetical protein
MRAEDFLNGATAPAVPSAEEFLGQPESSSMLRRGIADPAISLLKGAIAVPEAAVGLANIPTMGLAGKFAEGIGFRPKDARAELDTWYSPEQQSANKRVQDAKGFFPTVQAAVENPSVIGHTVAESVPSMMGGAAIARGLLGAGGGALARSVGATAAPTIAGAAGEGIVGAGLASEQIRQQTPTGTLTPEQLGYIGASGIGTALIGAAGGAAARKMGLSDVDTMLAGGVGTAGTRGMPARVLGGAASEGMLEEMPQSAQEQAWQNLALNKPVAEGMPEQAAMGLLSGAVMGGAGGIVPQRQAAQQPPGPLQKAADAAATTSSTIPQEEGQGIPQEEGVPPATIQAGTIPQTQQPAAGIAAAVQNTPAAPGTPFVPVSTAAPPPTTTQAESAGVPVSQPQEGTDPRGNEAEITQPAEPGQQAQPAEAADSAAAEKEWRDFVATEGRDIGPRQLAVILGQFRARRRQASGIEAATGRVEDARQREVAANRMAVLESLPLTTTGNTIRRFAAALRNAGIRDYRVSPEERQMIARRIDARDTLQPLEQEPTNELTLPEKREAKAVAPTVPRMDALRRKMATPGARIVGNRLLDRHGKRLDTLSSDEVQELAPKKQQAPKKTVAADELDAFIKEEAANLGRRRSMLLSLQAIRKQKQSEDDRADLDALIEAERADLIERRARLQDAHAAAREKKPFVVPPLRTPEQPTTGGGPIEQQATALPLGKLGKRSTVDATKTPSRAPQQPLSSTGEQQPKKSTPGQDVNMQNRDRSRAASVGQEAVIVPPVVAPDTPRPELGLLGQTPEEVAAADIAAKKAKHDELIARSAASRKEKAAKDKAEKDRRAADALKAREAAKKAEADKAAEEFALGQAAPEPVVKKVTTEEARGQEDLRFSFAGQQSATADQFQLARAKQLLAVGASADGVRQQTGWFKNPSDGKWRYEIDDSDASLKAHGFSFGELLDALGKNLTLAEVLDHPALFAAYPSIARSAVDTIDEKSKNNGQLSKNQDGSFTILVNASLDESKALSTLLHEIQHGIQNVEGFASGGSPSQFKTMTSDEVAELLKKDLINAMSAAAYKSWFLSKTNAPTSAQQKAINRVNAARQAIKTFDENGYDPRLQSANERYRKLAGEVEARSVQRRQNFPADRRKYSDPIGTQDVAAEDVIVMFNGKDAKDAPAPANTTRASAMAAIGASPADAAVFDMAAEGKSAQEILSFLSKASRRPFNRVLANALSRIGVSSSVSVDQQAGWRNVQNRQGARFAASYSPKLDAVTLFTPRNAEIHALHEFVHAASMKAVARGGIAARRMQAIFDYVQKTGTMSDQYGMGNFSRFPNETDAQFKKRALDEFVAELFTNPQFQVRLKQLPAPSGSNLKSAWDWIVRAIANLLGMRTKALETALDRALSVGTALLQENADLTMPKGETARYHTTWHGSPHKFYTFDLSKIGTGEGAQAYGHGLYVAEAPEVARSYKDVLSSNRNARFDGRAFSVTADDSGMALSVRVDGISDDFRGGVPYQEELAAGLKSVDEALSFIKKRTGADELNITDFDRSKRNKPFATDELLSGEVMRVSPAGSFYKVDLPAEAIARMLDWDAGLHDNPRAVKIALKKDDWDTSTPNENWDIDVLTGEDVIRELFDQLGSKQAVSEHLLSIGIQGVRYLDQSSRNKGKGTHNFVLFDDKLARIIEVNGVETGVQPWAPGEWEAAQGDMRYAIAWHGTPHVWPPEPGFPHGRPRLDKIGSGEGVQAYGWGWYSAEAQQVADSYRTLPGGAFSVDGKTYAQLQNAWFDLPKPYRRAVTALADSAGDTKEALTNLEAQISPASKQAAALLKEWISAGAVKSNKGQVYRLDIPDDVMPKLLNWDNPLDQQTDPIKDALRKVIDSRYDSGTFDSYIKASEGGDFRDLLSNFDEFSDRELSEELAEAGVPGLRYLDGGSRNKGKGTYNYVIWDQKVLDRIALLERNGEKLDAIRSADEVRFSQASPFDGSETATTPLKLGATTLMVDGVERPALNSNGKPIHWSEEGVRNFWRWFQNSAVTDDNGRPLVATHMTGEPWTVYDKSKARDSAVWGKGLYLSLENKWVSGAANNEMQLYIRSVNPLDITGPLEEKELETLSDYVGRKVDVVPLLTMEKRSGSVTQGASDAGFDGIIHLGPGSTGRHIVVFTPEQVKSATGNTGAFSEDPDIRYSAADNWQQSPIAPGNLYQAAKKKAASLLTPERIDKLIYEMQDKFIDLRRIRDHIKEIGGTITDMNDAYLGEELYHKRLAHRTEQFLKEELQPFFADMKALGVTMPEFEKFLHARHAPEANAEMAKRNPNQQQIDAGRQKSAATVRVLELKLQTAKARGLATVAIEKALNDARADLVRWNGAQAFRGTEEERLSLSGMSNAAAGVLMASMTPEQRADMNALAAKVDAINEGTLQALERYGLMDKAALNTWRNTYQHYVPLHRDEAHPDSASHPIGQGFNVRGDASKRRTGSNQEVTNIFGHIAMQREAALTRGEKNRVMQKLYLMARQNPSPDIWAVGKVPMIDTIDKATGFVRSVPDPQYKDKPNVVTLRIGGKDVAIVMNEYNPQALRLAQSIKNLDVDDLHYLIPVVGKATRWFASINTQYNPIFGLINFARDVQTAALNLSTTEIAGKQKEVFKDTMSILGDIIKNKGRMPTAGKWAPIYKEFNEVGGTTGYRDLFLTAEDRSKAVTDEIKALGRGKVSQVAHAVAGWLSDYNEAMENATRLAAYKAAIDNGMSKERAASLAKNLTVNFNRKGRQTRELGALYAFFNAAVQGTARMAQTLSGPTGKKIMLGGVLAGAASAMAGIAAMGGGDGEDDEWSKIPEFVKERSLIIPSPFSKEGYFTIPMPLGFHFLPNIGRLMVEMAVYKDKTAGKQMASLFTVLADAFNPLGGSAPPMQIIAPTVMDPFVALAQNKDWTGKPIYVENFNSLNPQPGAERAKDSATPIAKGMADAINAATGGTKYVPGAWSPTPDQIDYVIGQLTGGVGREIGKLSSTVAAPFTGDELPAHKIPLLGRLYGSTAGASGQAERFYANIKRSNEAENEIKGRRKDGISVDDYLQDNPKAIELAARGNAAERQIRALRQMRSRIVEAGGDDATSKARQINERMATVMRNFNMQAERMQ